MELSEASGIGMPSTNAHNLATVTKYPASRVPVSSDCYTVTGEHSNQDQICLAKIV